MDGSESTGPGELALLFRRQWESPLRGLQLASDWGVTWLRTAVVLSGPVLSHKKPRATADFHIRTGCSEGRGLTPAAARKHAVQGSSSHPVSPAQDSAVETSGQQRQDAKVLVCHLLAPGELSLSFVVF